MFGLTRPLRVALAVAAVVLLAAFAVIGFALVGGGFFNQNRDNAGCGPAGGDQSVLAAAAAAGGDESTQAPNDDQKHNAAIIVEVGRQLQVPERGQWVALATAMQESGLHNLDYGDRDSLGLFQQRPSAGWGSPQQVTDPVYAATQFYQHLVQVPGWEQMPLWQAAQSVQRSAFPTAYSKWENYAAALLAAVGQGGSAGQAGGQNSDQAGAGVSLASTDVCGARGGASGAGAAPWAGGSTGCVEEDPTSKGCLTGATRHALDEVTRVFGGYSASSLIQSTGCWDAHEWNPKSDHPAGKACDFFPGAAGVFAQGNQLQAGWELANWFRANADALQVNYVIWQGRIWSISHGDTDNGWGQPYNGGGVYDPTEATGGHFDHVHVSFRE